MADRTTQRPDGGQPARPPVRRGVTALRLAVAAAVLWGTIALVGEVLFVRWQPATLLHRDASTDRWLASHRNPALDSLTKVGSTLAETMTAIAVAAAAVLVLRWWLGRWRESVTLVVVLTGEVLVFLLLTLVIDRERPSVAHLDAAPPTSSFPSGHTAAAVAIYGCLAVIVWRNLRNRPVALVLCVVLWCLPVVVAVSRLYRGMHFPTDVLGGALVGGLWLVAVVATLLPKEPERQDERHSGHRATDLGRSSESVGGAVLDQRA